MGTTPIDTDAVMAGIKLKLRRAQGLLDDFFLDLDRLLGPNSRGDARLNEDGSLSALYVPQAVPPPEYGILVGDFAHNVRSALDNLVTVLLARNGAVPNTGHKFPISTSEADWDGRVAGPYPERGPLAKVRQEDFDVIRSVQPFHAGPDGAEHPLTLLAQVNNADKHGALHGTVAAIARVGQDVVSVDPPLPVEIVGGAEPGVPLQPGDEVTRYRVLGPLPNYFEVRINWPLVVSFTDHKGRSVAQDQLPEMWNAVVRVVGHWDEEIRADQQ